jgi:outer membrane protein assembly factor BamB
MNGHVLAAIVSAVLARSAAGGSQALQLGNASFLEGATQDGLPVGWSRYAGGRTASVRGGKDQRLSVVGTDKGRAVLLEDGDPAAEVGIYQEVLVKPGETYRASAMVRGVVGTSSAGAYLQLRFLPSDKYSQTALDTKSETDFTEVSVTAVAPADAKTARIHLYTHKEPTPKVMVAEVKLEAGVPNAPAAPPEPIPPQYDRLKDLHVATALVADGSPGISLVVPASGVYDKLAVAVQQAVKALTEATIPIVMDNAPEAAVPVKGNVIALGNRSTNRLLSDLYDQFYTLLDLKYPGPGGYVVQTLHNPFGNGHNVILVGGSDTPGVEAATQVLVEKLRAASAGKGNLSLGWTMAIKLGKGVTVSHDLKDLEIWDASQGYGSSGYFGWNSLSKRMAAYYMTGDPFHAREVVRLSFPDAQALKEIDQFDQEMIEGKKDPLAGPYHYSAHYMVLFWDLIEESPVFTDEERLKVTNAISRQLSHRKVEGIYGRAAPASSVGDRHGDWAAVSLYCLGRYFQKDYPDPIWQQCLDSVHRYYTALANHAWLAGYNDHLFWYNTYFEPIESYLLLSGDRRGLDSGNLQKALRTQDILYTGKLPDPGLRTAAISWLNKTAYLTGDGRWLFYRDRTELDTTVFRLGQSFWPRPDLQPHPPEELLGKWTLQEMPEPMWKARGSGLPLAESFLWGAFRSRWDGGGDFLQLDGFNGGGRNPYHTIALMDQRLNGTTTFTGYYNQVLTSADGMVEPVVAMDGALRLADVVGDTAIAVLEVPKTPFANWKRTIAQRVGRYALFVDELTFRTDSGNLEVQTTWSPVGGTWDAKANALRLAGQGTGKLPEGWLRFRALESPYTSSPPGAEHTSKLDSLDIVLLKSTNAGDWIEMAFRLDKPASGEVFADLLNYTDRGTVRLHLDGKPVVDEFQHYAASVTPARVPLGRHELSPGEHTLRVEVLGKQPGVDRCYVGCSGVSLRPDGAPERPRGLLCELLPSEVMPTTPGSVVAMTWAGAVRNGDRRIAFYLLGQREPTVAGQLACLQLAPDAAALALPEPAVAAVGTFRSMTGDLVVLAADHLHGQAMTSAGLDPPLLRADQPIGADWDFTEGVLEVVAGKDTSVRLSVAPAGEPKLDGKAVRFVAGEDGLALLQLPAGRHRLEGVKPPDTVREALATQLGAALTEAKQRRAGDPEVSRPTPKPEAPELATLGAANVGGAILDLTTMPSAGGPLVCAAAGKAVHVLTLDGKEVRQLSLDGDVRVLRWWQEHKLLLVGCADEKVVAFDQDGTRKWEFTSEMDPAVYEAGKQYWFKSAYPGVHGLHTGVFLDGKSQAFVGSACTLEILDENGKLVKRLPVFWGNGWKFNLIDGPDDSVNLLLARWPNGTDELATVNSKTLAVGQGFTAVPAGHSFVGGWTAMNRVRTIWDDLDGDGKKELVSGINGVWNRVTVYTAEGTPRYNAQFGPGDKAPAVTLSDMDACDLNGDGKKEIVVAKASGLVVALDHQCRKLWSKRLPSPPRVLRCVTPSGGAKPWVVVGCEDGTVLALDGAGEVQRTGKVTGRPVHLTTVATPSGPVLVFGTSAGEVKCLGGSR